MDWTNLPPLTALRAFAALAEAQSFSEAGRRLNVTHAAVVQQVRALERYLDRSLVVRSGRSVRLTPAGQQLASDLSAGFRRIQNGVDTLRTEEMQRPLQVSTSPAFAVAWLMPRLPAFQTAHPNITLLLNPTSRLVELGPGLTDVAIRYTEDKAAFRESEVLFAADMVVVGTPQLLGSSPPGDPRSLLDLPWLQELGTTEASDWLVRQGVTLHHPLSITQMPGNLILEAVRRGDGLTYTVRDFVADDIRAGRLVEVSRSPAFGTFYIATGPGTPRPAVRSFVRWLKRQVKERRAAPA